MNLFIIDDRNLGRAARCIADKNTDDTKKNEAPEDFITWCSSSSFVTFV
jgi:hypothetical protein